MVSGWVGYDLDGMDIKDSLKKSCTKSDTNKIIHSILK